MKSFKPKEPRADGDGGGDDGSGGRNAPAEFRGEKRSNQAHCHTTDPDARLSRKGRGMEAKLRFIGHGLMENRSGLIVDARLTRVSGHAERLAALDMIEGFAAPSQGKRPRAITLGADKGYDAADFVGELRTINVRPHVARNTSGRRSTIDRRTTRHPGYAKTQRIRKRIEEAFGSIKTVAGSRKTKLRGLPRVDWSCTSAECPQSGAGAEADRGDDMSAAAGCELIGRWRIVEADLWDRDYLDLVEPAYMTFAKNGRGEFTFGVVNATMELGYGRRTVLFNWTGFDEGDEICGSSSAELEDDGAIEIGAAPVPERVPSPPPSVPRSCVHPASAARGNNPAAAPPGRHGLSPRQAPRHTPKSAIHSRHGSGGPSSASDAAPANAPQTLYPDDSSPNTTTYRDFLNQ